MVVPAIAPAAPMMLLTLRGAARLGKKFARQPGGNMIKTAFAGVAAIGILANFAIAPSRAAEPTVGIVAAFSGAYAEWGAAYKREIDLYMFQHNGKDGNPKINLILRDAPGASDVPRTKQVVQEFITRDNAAVVGGGEFTPEALAVAPLVTEAKVPYVIFNGATSFIVDKSPYLVRVGYTIWQPTAPIPSPPSNTASRSMAAPSPMLSRCRSAPTTSPAICSASRIRSRNASSPSCPAARWR